MAIPTYTTFVQALADMDVTGVKREYRELPRAVNSADLPCSFVRIPSGTEGPFTACGQGGYPEMRCELVILVKSYQQSTNPANMEETLTIIDSLSTALRGANLGVAKQEWELRSEFVGVGDDAYWSIVCDVRGRGPA